MMAFHHAAQGRESFHTQSSVWLILLDCWTHKKRQINIYRERERESGVNGEQEVSGSLECRYFMWFDGRTYQLWLHPHRLDTIARLDVAITTRYYSPASWNIRHLRFVFRRTPRQREPVRMLVRLIYLCLLSVHRIKWNEITQVHKHNFGECSRELLTFRIRLRQTEIDLNRSASLRWSSLRYFATMRWLKSVANAKLKQIFGLLASNDQLFKTADAQTFPYISPAVPDL